MIRLFLFISLQLIAAGIFAQQVISPLEQNQYEKVTSYEQLSEFVLKLDKLSDILSVEIIGKSVQGRNLYALKFSTSELGKDKSKLKVIFFAQQHGNEQSGKEGALKLAIELLKPENKYLFDKIDFALIPQMNPDGSEINKRRNANGKDLNRNHMLMTEPEVIALHQFFEKYMFDVNLDVHEYYPYGEESEKFGYRKNADITLGTATNPNISKIIRDYSNDKISPFVLDYEKEKGFTSFIYAPGGPPEIAYIRHSTFDINDGRQSFGILNSFGFIQEGLNGTDSYLENIEHRTSAQMTGMYALLLYAFNQKDDMKKIVLSERKKLTSGKASDSISIQGEHVKTDKKLLIPLYSYYSKTDSVFQVIDYRPVVKSIYNVNVPFGYLIPKDKPELMEWTRRNKLQYSEYKSSKNHSVMQYNINTIDSVDFEGEMVVNPNIRESEFQNSISPADFIFIPFKQIKGKKIVLALEPKSMLGLVTYKQFAHLLKAGETYPVLRVMKK